MKFKKGFFAVFLGLIISIMVLPSQAEARYLNTESIKSSIIIDSSGLATCYGDVVGIDGTSNIKITLSLQRQNSDGSYTTVKSWDTVEKYGFSLSVTKQYYVTSGYSYRVYVEAEVIRSKVTEYVDVYSSVVKYN